MATSNSNPQPKNYYQDWRYLGYQFDLIAPVAVPNGLQFTIRYPFFFSSLLATYNVPTATPHYDNAGIVSLTGAQNNTYKDMLFAMYIAMAFANRDVDNPDGITSYTGITGMDFSGYFKNYLNEKLLPLNWYRFTAWPSYIYNRAIVNAAASNTGLFNSEITYPQLTWTPFDRKLMGAPGIYTLYYDGTTTPAPYSAGLNLYNANLGIGSLKILTYMLKSIE